MKDIHYDGLEKKKQCVRLLLLKSMSEHKRRFLFWH